MNWSNVVNVLNFNLINIRPFLKLFWCYHEAIMQKAFLLSLLLIYCYRHSQNICYGLSIPVIFNSCSIIISYIDSITAFQYECAFNLRFSNLVLLISLSLMKSISFFHLWHILLWLMCFIIWQLIWVLYNFVYGL